MLHICAILPKWFADKRIRVNTEKKEDDRKLALQLDSQWLAEPAPGTLVLPLALEEVWSLEEGPLAWMT